MNRTRVWHEALHRGSPTRLGRNGVLVLRGMSTLRPATQEILHRYGGGGARASTENIPLRMPSVFLSHGSPMAALADAEDRYFREIQEFFGALPRPRAVVVASAHGLSPLELVEVNSAARPSLVYDFGGFPASLYQIQYPCPGDPLLAQQIADMARGAGFTVQLNERAGIDHGVWVPLRIAYPAADVPVIQISLPYGDRPHQAMRLGQALAPLRKEGVLLLGSGGLVHNLGQLTWHAKHGSPRAWALEFEQWVQKALQEKRVDDLLHFSELAPHAGQAHPTVEHFYPLLFTLGGSLPGDDAWSIYEGFEYETLSMFSFCLA